jgi:short-subunit dehydrogenase
MARNILITGVSTGIGKSFVELASTTYPNDTIIAFTRNPLTYKVPSNIFVYNVDISDFKAVAKIFKKATRRHGDIDILINNAGNGIMGTIEDTTIEQAKSQFEVNVWAAVNLIHLVLPTMRRKKSGHIINISSVASEFDYPTMAYYGMSKALIEKLSRILAMELRPWNITVSVVAPGTIKSKFGTNIIRPKNPTQSPYKDLYKRWSRHFAVMFQKHMIHSEAVAAQLVKVINKPQPKSLVGMRDIIYSTLHKHSSREFFAKHVLGRYLSSK